MSDANACFKDPACAECVEADATLARLNVPRHLHRGMRLYAVHHAPTGSFLRACFTNDLQAAVCGADEESREALLQIAWWIWNEAPGPCHGSPEKVAAWVGRPSEPATS